MNNNDIDILALHIKYDDFLRPYRDNIKGNILFPILLVDGKEFLLHELEPNWKEYFDHHKDRGSFLAYQKLPWEIRKENFPIKEIIERIFKIQEKFFSEYIVLEWKNKKSVKEFGKQVVKYYGTLRDHTNNIDEVVKTITPKKYNPDSVSIRWRDYVLDFTEEDDQDCIERILRDVLDQCYQIPTPKSISLYIFEHPMEDIKTNAK